MYVHPSVLLAVRKATLPPELTRKQIYERWVCTQNVCVWGGVLSEYQLRGQAARTDVQNHAPERPGGGTAVPTTSGRWTSAGTLDTVPL